jgi:hypothetical protein
MGIDIARDLSSEDARVRLAAVQAALETKNRDAADLIAEVLPREPHPKVRLAMVYALGKLGSGPAHAGAVAAAADDPEPRIRVRAAEALATINDPLGHPVLVKLLGGDAEPMVRDVAAHAVLKLGKQGVIELLEQMIDSDRAWMREAAIQAAQQFNSRSVVPLLVRVAKTAEDDLQELARAGLRRLSEMGDATAKDALAEIDALHRLPPVAPDDLFGKTSGTIKKVNVKPPMFSAPRAKKLPDPDAADASGEHTNFTRTYTGRKLADLKLDPDPFGAGASGISQRTKKES